MTTANDSVTLGLVKAGNSKLKKRVILIFISLLLILAAIVWFSTRPEPPIQVIGNLSAKDVAEIKQRVRKKIRSDVLPDFSWSSVRAFPSSARECFKRHVFEIEEATNGMVIVICQRAIDEGMTNEEFYGLARTTNGWAMFAGPVWDLPHKGK